MAEGCSEQKYDVANDLTSDPATARRVSDNIFVAGLDQVCRIREEGREGRTLRAQGRVIYKRHRHSPALKIASVI